MPPDGKLDASGSPLTSSLPENSATALPSPVGEQKRVVLFGGDAGQRLEPVRVVRRAVLDRPLLHRGRDRVGHRDVERLAVRHRAPQRVIDRLRQARLLHFVVEHQAAERFGRARPARLLRFRHRPVANRADRFAEHCEPMTSPPLSAGLDSAHHIARVPKCALSQYSCRLCNESRLQFGRITQVNSAHLVDRFVQIMHESANATSSGRVQPSSARNSASTIAVAPQISTPAT